METVVMLIMVLASFNFLLKLTFRKRWTVLAVALFSALFLGFAWKYAILQSRTQIADWLANPSLMQDTAVILCLDVFLQMTFCIVAANLAAGDPVKKGTLRLYRFLRWFPGLLIFPVLFSFLVFAIFSFPGVSFPLVSWSLAAAVLLLIPSGVFLFRKVIPEKEVRMELLFLTHALLAILGIVATVNGTTAVQGIEEVDWKASAGTAAIAFGGISVGYIFHLVIRTKRSR